MQLFETEPMDFLIKTIQKEQIERVVKRFLKKQKGMEKVITFREGHGNVQIPYSSLDVSAFHY